MISIIVPTCSRARECSSFIKNIYGTQGIEIIVVENGSSFKEKEEYSKLFKPFFSTVKLIFSFEQGASNARNFGASIASSEWVWFIDDDDFVSQNTIIDCVRACSSCSYDVDMLMLSFKLSSDIDIVHSFSDTTATYRYIRRFGHFGNANILIIKKTFFNEVEGWDGNLQCGQDTDLFLRIFQNNPILSFVDTTPVEINDDDRDRITLNTKIQMLGKLFFIRKHWRNLHFLRLLRYVLSFVIAWPIIKKYYYKIQRAFF